jgi:hypothetical protein
MHAAPTCSNHTPGDLHVLETKPGSAGITIAIVVGIIALVVIGLIIIRVAGRGGRR